MVAVVLWLLLRRSFCGLAVTGLWLLWLGCSWAAAVPVPVAPVPVTAVAVSVLCP